MFYETTLCFFAEWKLKILISVLFYRHTHDQKSKAEQCLVAYRCYVIIVSCKQLCDCNKNGAACMILV